MKWMRLKHKLKPELKELATLGRKLESDLTAYQQSIPEQHQKLKKHRYMTASAKIESTASVIQQKLLEQSLKEKPPKPKPGEQPEPTLLDDLQAIHLTLEKLKKENVTSNITNRGLDIRIYNFYATIYKFNHFLYHVLKDTIETNLPLERILKNRAGIWITQPTQPQQQHILQSGFHEYNKQKTMTTQETEPALQSFGVIE